MEFTPAKGQLPRKQRLLKVEPAEVLVTAVRRCEKRDSILIRLVNLAQEKVDAVLTCGLALKEVYRLDLLQRRRKELDFKRNRVRLHLGAKEIATLELGV